MSDKIVLMKLKGNLTQGKTGDIHFSEIEEFINKKEAYSFLKNISSLKTQVTEFEIESLSTDNVESIEKQILDNYTAKNPTNFNKYLPQLMSTLSIEKNEDEKSIIYENRLLSDLKSILEIEEVLV